MRTRRFRELIVWQDSMALARAVYAVAGDFPAVEKYGMASQLCRAAVSIPSNIAEGHGRLSDKSFALFLGHARGSLFELETQLEIARQPALHQRRTAPVAAGGLRENHPHAECPARQAAEGMRDE
jgi:four helix bundle protein